ncbi:hypothetical protein NQ318_007121, partial [Aromia moschata]
MILGPTKYTKEEFCQGRYLKIKTDDGKQYNFEVGRFKYLGTIFKRQPGASKEINSRITAGNRCIGALNVRKNTPRKTKTKMEEISEGRHKKTIGNWKEKAKDRKQWKKIVDQAMGQLGSVLSQILPSTGTPVLATFLSGFAAALASLFIRLEILVEMMSIGRNEASSAPGVRKFLRKVRETGMLMDNRSRPRACPVRTAERIAAVAQSSLHNNVSRTSLRRILHKDLGLFAYKLQLTQEVPTALDESRRAAASEPQDSPARLPNEGGPLGGSQGQVFYGNQLRPDQLKQAIDANLGPPIPSPSPSPSPLPTQTTQRVMIRRVTRRGFPVCNGPGTSLTGGINVLNF